MKVQNKHIQAMIDSLKVDTDVQCFQLEDVDNCGEKTFIGLTQSSALVVQDGAGLQTCTVKFYYPREVAPKSDRVEAKKHERSRTVQQRELTYMPWRDLITALDLLFVGSNKTHKDFPVFVALNKALAEIEA